jgi:hypothetical protein
MSRESAADLHLQPIFLVEEGPQKRQDPSRRSSKTKRLPASRAQPISDSGWVAPKIGLERQTLRVCGGCVGEIECAQAGKIVGGTEDVSRKAVDNWTKSRMQRS